MFPLHVHKINIGTSHYSPIILFTLATSITVKLELLRSTSSYFPVTAITFTTLIHKTTVHEVLSRSHSDNCKKCETAVTRRDAELAEIISFLGETWSLERYSKGIIHLEAQNPPPRSQSMQRTATLAYGDSHNQVTFLRDTYRRERSSLSLQSYRKLILHTLVELITHS